MNKWLVVFTVLFLASCQSKDEFRISGKIANAQDQMLYLDLLGLDNTKCIDSVRLDEDGDFELGGVRPMNPEFYALRIGNQQVDFVVDSCEHLSLQADAKGLLLTCKWEKSPLNNQILNLKISVAQIQQLIDSVAGLDSIAQNPGILKVKDRLLQHKANVGAVIFQQPHSHLAYYALHQQVNQAFIFSAYAKEDRPFYAAVANAYLVTMPTNPRAMSMKAILLDAIKSEKTPAKKKVVVEAPEAKGFIEIELKNTNSQTKKLSQLLGDVVIVAFSDFQQSNIKTQLSQLQKLYAQYEPKRMSIYQVDMSANQTLWLKNAKTLPWTNVFEPDGIQSVLAGNYNIQSLPVYFLMDRSGNLVGRFDDLVVLEDKLAQLTR